MSHPLDDATRLVADDPFWSVVRRRHPQVDVVILPAEAGRAVPTPPGTPIAPDPAMVAAREESGVRRLWVRLVGDLGPVPARWDARWIPGGEPDRVRREVTQTADQLPEELVGRPLRERLLAAADALRDQGWHVTLPPRGLPRVLAGRAGDHAGAEAAAWQGREELQLVAVEASRRLVLRFRGVEHAVGADVARQLVAGLDGRGVA